MASIKTSIHNEHSLAIHTVKGHVRAEEIARKIEEYHSGEPEKFAIWDFSEAAPANLTHEQLQSLAEFGKKCAERRKGGKTALVVPHDLSFGLGRIWESLTEIESFEVENRAFRSMEKARNWLGIET